MNQMQLDTRNLQMLQQEVDLMKHAIDAYQRKVVNPEVRAELIENCRERICKAATTIGDFETALAYVNTNEEATLLVRLRRAFNRDEEEDCHCSPNLMPSPDKLLEIPKLFKWMRVYDREKAVWRDVYKCSKCSFMTAHPNGVASQQARALEQARGKVDNKQKKQFKDHEVIRQL